jgi:hypothetical protein
MNKTFLSVIAAVSLAGFAVPMAQADSISAVEGARAKERQGRYLNRGDREQLRRYGGNDDYGWRGRDRGYYDEGYYDDGPGVSVYVGPGGVGVHGY